MVPLADDGGLEGDVCREKTSCNTCTADSRCGWCDGTMSCFAGSERGPKTLTCSSWQFQYCSGQSCDAYKLCAQCLADPYCGWCRGEAPAEGKEAKNPMFNGNCMDVGSSGPLYGECSAEWLHSRVRQGTPFRLAASMDMAHKGYLQEMCEAGDKHLFQPKAPAPQLAAPKDPVVLTVQPLEGPVFGQTVVTLTGLYFGDRPGARYGTDLSWVLVVAESFRGVTPAAQPLAASPDHTLTHSCCTGARARLPGTPMSPNRAPKRYYVDGTRPIGRAHVVAAPHATRPCAPLPCAPPRCTGLPPCPQLPPPCAPPCALPCAPPRRSRGLPPRCPIYCAPHVYCRRFLSSYVFFPHPLEPFPLVPLLPGSLALPSPSASS